MLAACNDNAGVSRVETGRAPSEQATKATQHTSGALTVKIIPDNPTVATPLQALITYSGPGQAICQWEINGRPLEGERSPTLSADNARFSKRDRISVTVTADGSTATASTTIVNAVPSIKKVDLKMTAAGKSYDIIAEPMGTDADGDAIQYQYAWTVNGAPVGGNTPLLEGASTKRGDQVVLTVTPFDSEGPGVPFVADNITLPKAPPFFVSAPQTASGRAEYSYQAVAEDPDGEAVTYALTSGPPGMTIDAKTGKVLLKITKEHNGQHTVQIAARNASGLQTEQKFILTLTVN